MIGFLRETLWTVYALFFVPRQLERHRSGQFTE